MCWVNRWNKIIEKLYKLMGKLLSFADFRGKSADLAEPTGAFNRQCCLQWIGVHLPVCNYWLTCMVHLHRRTNHALTVHTHFLWTRPEGQRLLFGTHCCRPAKWIFSMEVSSPGHFACGGFIGCAETRVTFQWPTLIVIYFSTVVMAN